VYLKGAELECHRARALRRNDYLPHVKYMIAKRRMQDDDEGINLTPPVLCPIVHPIQDSGEG